MTRIALAVGWLVLWAAVLGFAVLPARPAIPTPARYTVQVQP